MADKYPGSLKRTEYAAFVVFNDQIKLQLYQNIKSELTADLFFLIKATCSIVRMCLLLYFRAAFRPTKTRLSY